MGLRSRMNTASVTRTPTSPPPARGPRLGDGVFRPVKARVMRHHRAGAAARRAAEGGESAEIGVDRRHRRQPQQPEFERLVGAAERSRRQRPAMVVGVGERRHGEPAARRRRRAGAQRRDMFALDDDVDEAFAFPPEQGHAEDFVHGQAPFAAAMQAAGRGGHAVDICFGSPPRRSRRSLNRARPFFAAMGPPDLTAWPC